MSVPSPYLFCPTPESRRAALLEFRALGLHWGRRPSPIESDIKLLNDIDCDGTIFRYWAWLPKDKCMFIEVTIPHPTVTTNSPIHFVSYLRRHGLWRPTTHV